MLIPPNVRSFVVEAGDKGVVFSFRGADSDLAPNQAFTFAKLNRASEVLRVKRGQAQVSW